MNFKKEIRKLVKNLIYGDIILTPEKEHILDMYSSDFIKTTRDACKEQRKKEISKLNGCHSWYEGDKNRDKGIEFCVEKIKELPLVMDEENE